MQQKCIHPSWTTIENSNGLWMDWTKRKAHEKRLNNEEDPPKPEEVEWRKDCIEDLNWLLNEPSNDSAMRKLGKIKIYSAQRKED